MVGSGVDLATRRLVDPRRGRPRLAVLALPEGKLAQRCGFQILPRAKQFARFLPNPKQNPRQKAGILINGGQYRI